MNVRQKEKTKKFVEKLNAEKICEIGPRGKIFSDSLSIDIDPATEPEICHDVETGIPLEDKSMDVCIVGDVIEHIYNSKLFLTDAKRVLKPGGYLIITCPNVCSLKYRIAFLIGKIPAHAAKADCTYPDPKERGHIRDYNYYELAALLKNSGFMIVYSEPLKNFRNSLMVIARRPLLTKQ